MPNIDFEVKTAIEHRPEEWHYIYGVFNEDHEPIARLGIHRFMNSPGFKWALLSDLYVQEEYRRQGFATQMIQKAIEDITPFGFGIYLLCIHDNEEAIALYRKIGFRKIRDYHFQDHPTTYYVFAYGDAPTKQLGRIDFAID